MCEEWLALPNCRRLYIINANYSWKNRSIPRNLGFKVLSSRTKSSRVMAKLSNTNITASTKQTTNTGFAIHVNMVNVHPAPAETKRNLTDATQTLLVAPHLPKRDGRRAILCNVIKKRNAMFLKVPSAIAGLTLPIRVSGPIGMTGRGLPGITH